MIQEAVPAKNTQGKKGGGAAGSPLTKCVDKHLERKNVCKEVQGGEGKRDSYYKVT